MNDSNKHDDCCAGTHADAALSLTEAQARTPSLKAPAEDEPLIVPGSSTVVPVVSIQAAGEPLTPVAIGRLLANEQGALKGTDGMRVAPLMNMVENDRQQELARAAAAAALAMTSHFDRALLCSLKPGSEFVVSVVTR